MQFYVKMLDDYRGLKFLSKESDRNTKRVKTQ